MDVPGTTLGNHLVPSIPKRFHKMLMIDVRSALGYLVWIRGWLDSYHWRSNLGVAPHDDRHDDLMVRARLRFHNRP